MMFEIFGDFLEVSLHWEIYAAALIYLAIALIPALVLSLAFREGGVALAMITQPFFQALGMLGFVCLVLPIATGLNDEAPWELPWQLLTQTPWNVFNACLKMLLATVIVAFIPIVGRVGSLSTLVLGIVATQVVFDLVGLADLELRYFMPPFGVAIGILAIAAAVSFLGFLLIALFSSLIDSFFGGRNSGIGAIISFPLVGVLGFTPLLVYYSWMGIALM